MTGEFKISVLASGSKGNATIITAGGKNFLIDAGISCRQLTQRIKRNRHAAGGFGRRAFDARTLRPHQRSAGIQP